MGRLVEFAPAPGIVKDLTANAATGRWVDCDKVRFRQGFPEKIGGWQKATTSTFVGICRALHAWVSLDDGILLAIGTHLKYYVEESGTPTDVTPIRSTVTLGADPFASTSGSGVITVTHAAHGAQINDYVTFSGATTFGGLTTGDLNKEHQIISVPTSGTYTVNTGGTATSTTTGGGASVSAAYQINTGASSSVFGSGWGAGTWSRGTWSSAAETTTLSQSIRLWSQSNWGEDLLFAPRYGVIYRYDAGSPGRGVAISTEGGASQVPTVVTEILVAPNERIVFALGCNAIGSSDHDELLIRWTDQENYLQWNPASTNMAGGFRLSSGSRIVTGLVTTQEILVWTDNALFSLQFVGDTADVYQSRIVAPNTSIIGANAKASLNGVVYWMGQRGFYAYDGRVQRIPCPVEDYVFNNLSREDAAKVYCGTNDLHNEIIWMYAIGTGNGNECSRYVIYNTVENIWYIGSWPRTAWLDRGISSYPRAASTDGYIYTHEYGLDDGSTTPVSAISSYVSSAPLEIGGGEDMGRGDRLVFVNRMIPDVTFRNSTGATPTLTYTFQQRRYPGLAYEEENTSISKGTTVDRYTEKKSIRLRSRAIALKISNAEVGTDWRLGVQRFETRTDGRR